MKKKLVIYLLSTVIFIFAIVTVLFVSIFNYEYQQNLKDKLEINNNMIINLLKSNNLRDQEKFFVENLAHSELRVTYIDKKGKVIYDSSVNAETMGNHNDRQESIEARKSGSGFSVRYSSSTEKNMMYFATTFDDGLIIRSSMPIEIVNGLGSKYFKLYILAILFCAIMSIWFSLKLSYIIVKPITDLIFITSRISKGEIHRRARTLSGGEIGQLAKNFNEMADKLEFTLNEVTDKQNRLEAILQSMDSGVIAVDRKNKVIMINPYAKKMFGITKDIIGENLLDNIRDFQLEDIFHQSDDDYKEIKIVWPQERELRIKTADIINRSQHIGTVAVVQDITEVKKLEKMRTQFVANVSHELKTPLTSIKGFAETLKYVDDVETKEKFLNIINEEAERLTRLITDILTLSHIEQQKEIKKEKIDVNKIIRDVYNLMKNTADVKGIQLSIEQNSIKALLGDADRFKQMLINLVGNAINYSETGDSICIGTEVYDDRFILWVKDTGVGIAKKQIPRIFERFYRVDKARSRSNGGTGLGLAIVKHIVLQFNGKIYVESELGLGSKFIVEIPYNE
ncbi:cell wall metabolism sensor histidine kinase WalK [Clostridium tagluense]|uniref:two-component system histidine kinase PnpS n=1 Tax=Clostridium tagluense TaxID=360422 RepID=UPI001CF4247D|nr:ATP-binding protein [Clostridium tagluense]MCB2309644.1 cell wall metabolism sensor histidine kinase WalK [Clostridium tagluense]MCB2314826.1 cell wall metabolism sensor histidine kinase WalK [Clostridium tagluense]MCB2319675.1 cell wall metabolism sensor histidine kinase WalK [Clostridium tagluense]MCB2324238.1 cell wall metabolism sensor histidine kinase WalK [Clostridium tagluense]MCB2329089.1 cell wall metabolism sensor histidine kinase WalK [Clostridium tagluense]